MNKMHAHRSPRFSGGFTIPELLIALAAIVLIATVAFEKFATMGVGVSNTKLSSDVKKLNEVVQVYLASGGSLDGVTDPQAVLNQLKTVMTSAQAERQVGVMTGRGVDVRLVATMQSSNQASSGNLRAYWNSATKQFVLSSSGSAGVASFDLDNSLASTSPKIDNRSNSNELYNPGAGWVWNQGSNTSLPSVQPTSFDLSTLNPTSQMDPNLPVSGSAGGSTGSGGTSPSGAPPNGTNPGILPTPAIQPQGGVYPVAQFPLQVYIDPNGAPPGVSILRYQLNTTGGWTPYSGPFTVPANTTVSAVNASTNTALYRDSAIASQLYSPPPVVPTSGQYPGSTDAPQGLTTNWSKVSAGNILWMNSNFTLHGAVADGQMVFFSGGVVSFPFNGGWQSVTMPDAVITFSSQVTTPKTVFDSTTNTWRTTVPLSITTDIFLTGMGWQIPPPGIPSNISGNQVVMSGNFTSTNNLEPGVIAWQWQTAAYSNVGTNLSDFTQNMNNLGVQVVSGPVNGSGSYLAGAPINNINPNPISGGSGGGSSNYTGGHSGTAHISF